MFAEKAEHWTTWLARKCYGSSFRSRENRSSYAPKSNTPLLYDGSAEAQAIVKNAKEKAIDNPNAFGALAHALDYLKGRDVRGRFSYTQEFFTSVAIWDDERQEWLVQIEPTQTPR